MIFCHVYWFVILQAEIVLRLSNMCVVLEMIVPNQTRYFRYEFWPLYSSQILDMLSFVAFHMDTVTWLVSRGSSAKLCS
jgi:hypothetical protein